MLRYRRSIFLCVLAALLTVCVATAPIGAAEEPDAEPFGSLSSAESQQLFEQTFDSQIASMATDPSEVLAAADQLIETRDPFTALVDPAGAAERALIVSNVPLETPDGEVTDLDLQSAGEGFEPAAAVVPSEFPATAGGVTQLSDEIEISVDGLPGSGATARLVTALGDQAEVAAFYPEALADTDLIWSPTIQGAELFAQLRSVQSPEALSIDVALPDGASLEATDDGGAKAESSGELVLEVEPPVASDANGQQVPVTMAVQGDKLVLEFPHRGEGFAYPILVDPTYIADGWSWSTPGNTNGFNQWASSVPSVAAGMPPKFTAGTYCRSDVSWSCTASNYGLYLYAQRDRNLAAGDQAQWTFTASGTTGFVSHYSASGYYERASSPLTEPHGFIGIWSPTTGWGPNGGGANSFYSATNIAASRTNTDTTGRHIIFGMQTPSAVTTHSTWKYARLGQVTVQMQDPEAPTVSTASRTQPDSLTRDGTYNVVVNASDPGLGLKKIYLRRWTGSAWVAVNQASAKWENTTCTGSRTYPCPAAAGPITLSYDTGHATAGLPEGDTLLQVAAEDALGADAGTVGGSTHVGVSGGFWSRIDRTAPETTISSGPVGPTNSASPSFGFSSTEAGSAFRCRLDTGSGLGIEESCSSPKSYSNLGGGSYTFNVWAIDPAGNRDATAAVRSFTVDPQAPDTSIISGPSGPTNNPSPSFEFSSTETGSTFKCQLDGPGAAVGSEGVCSSPASYSNLADGDYTFKAWAVDPAGNRDGSAATQSFTSDTTDPILTASGDLLDVAAQPVGAASAVSLEVTDSGSGAVSASAVIDGLEDDAITQVCPEGGCSLGSAIDLDFSELAAGTHDYTLRAEDRAGNFASETGTFVLDPVSPTLAISGALVDAQGRPLDAPAAITAEADEAASGDSGLGHIEIAVDGTPVAGQEADCSTACPTGLDSSYTYDPADWGEGPHEVTITTSDRAGNSQSELVLTDVPPVEPAPSCPTSEPAEVSAVDVVAAEDAEAGALPAILSENEVSNDQQVDPTLIEATTSASPDPLSIDQAYAHGEVAAEISDGIQLENVACIEPAETTEAEEPVRQVGDAAVFANTAPATDTVVRPTATGASLIQSARADASPETFYWNLGLNDGDQLEELDNGGIAIVDPEAAAPIELTVPSEPTPAAEVLLKSSDAQLARSDYELRSAMAETGFVVTGVISRPFVLDSNNQVTLGTASIVSAGKIKVQFPLLGAGSAGVMNLRTSSPQQTAPGEARPNAGTTKAPPGMCNELPVTIWGKPGAKTTTIWGTKQRDVIYGTDGKDIIYGGGGADIICGWGGNDEIHGGTGGDYLWGQGGSDTIYGELLDDYVWGGAQDDRLIGGHGTDDLYGEDQNDFLRGDVNTDKLDGGNGRDTTSWANATGRVKLNWVITSKKSAGEIVGNSNAQAGHDEVIAVEVFVGTPYDDIFQVPATSTHIFGGRGLDKCSTTAPGGVAGNCGDSGPRIESVECSSGPDGPCATPTADTYVPSGFFSMKLDRRDAIIGGTAENPVKDDQELGLLVFGADQAGCEKIDVKPLPGNAGYRVRQATSDCSVEPVFGAGGTDYTITGELDYIVIHGRAGNDRIDVERRSGVSSATDPGPEGNTTVIVDGGVGSDRLTGEDGPYMPLAREIPGANQAKITTEMAQSAASDDGAEILVSGLQSGVAPAGEILSGRDDDDALMLTGPHAFDPNNRTKLYGGKGNDQIVSRSVCDGDIYEGGEGFHDILGFAQVTVGRITATLGEPPAPQQAEGTFADIFLTGMGCAQRATNRGFEVLEGTNVGDAGGGKGDTLTGNSDDNTIWGRNGDDLIHGKGGADIIDGDLGTTEQMGADTMFGDNGDDRIRGGSHVDSFYGGPGFDRINSKKPAGLQINDAETNIWCGADGAMFTERDFNSQRQPLDKWKVDPENNCGS